MTNLLDGLQRVQEALRYACEMLNNTEFEEIKHMHEALSLLPSLIEQVKEVERQRDEYKGQLESHERVVFPALKQEQNENEILKKQIAAILNNAHKHFTNAVNKAMSEITQPPKEG